MPKRSASPDFETNDDRVLSLLRSSERLRIGDYQNLKARFQFPPTAVTVGKRPASTEHPSDHTKRSRKGRGYLRKGEEGKSPATETSPRKLKRQAPTDGAMIDGPVAKRRFQECEDAFGKLSVDNDAVGAAAAADQEPAAKVTPKTQGSRPGNEVQCLMCAISQPRCMGSIERTLLDDVERALLAGTVEIANKNGTIRTSKGPNDKVKEGEDLGHPQSRNVAVKGRPLYQAFVESVDEEALEAPAAEAARDRDASARPSATTAAMAGSADRHCPPARSDEAVNENAEDAVSQATREDIPRSTFPVDEAGKPAIQGRYQLRKGSKVSALCQHFEAFADATTSASQRTRRGLPINPSATDGDFSKHLPGNSGTPLQDTHPTDGIAANVMGVSDHDTHNSARPTTALTSSHGSVETHAYCTTQGSSNGRQRVIDGLQGMFRSILNFIQDDVETIYDFEEDMQLL